VFYTDKAIDILDSIEAGYFSLEDNIEQIKAAAYSEIAKADIVICCGTLPFSKGFAQKMAQIKKCCYYLDSGDGEGMFAGCPLVSITDLEHIEKYHNVIYVIMSRSMLEFYHYVIKKTNPFAKILFYPVMELAYEECFTDGVREDYTPFGIQRSIQYIHDHVKEIKEILLSFSDAVSQEIYSRIVLFRLMFEMDLNLGIKSDKTEYLDDDIINWKQKEYIVDVGGYVGDTLFDFKEYFTREKIDFEYYLLEPSKVNCDEADLVAGDCENIHIKHCCAGDENKIVYLGSTMGSAITVNLSGEENGESAPMVRLDDMMSEKSVSYIKMDIEGSEEIALRGAENLIRTNSPKLAICIYHKYDDIVKLIQYVQGLTEDLGYNYYVRAQRESVVTEMVLYAIPK
jgi:FkbM family methyltransferase